MSSRGGESIFYRLGRLAGELGDDADSTPTMQREDRENSAIGPGTVIAGLLFVVGLGVSFASVSTAIALFALAGAVFVVSHSVVIVQAYERQTYTVLGAFVGVLEPGINFVPPFVSGTQRFDMRTTMLDVPKQEAITEDNSPVTANAVVYLHVMDAKKAFLEVEDYERAVGLLAQTALRAVIGDMTLDETLSRRDEINRRIREELDEPTDPWGVRVEAVEVQEVMPSDTVKHAMEQQSSAERRRRAMILEAQGERQSMVERAMGDKTSNVTAAEGAKQATVLEAQGAAVARVLRARAAESMGERAIIERGMETLERIGQGAATTYVIPQELTTLLGRYGEHISGGGGGGSPLEGKALEAAAREFIGMDDIGDLVEEVDPEDVAGVDPDDAAVEIEID
ncbi:SPFH domain-containing protein [Halocalculus aciditolerans]|uniref:Phosphoesterase n=1 Tax=Halocalculus aciditolerans TaxID=1383812 RepID=A0A830F1U2_9EURY|nr:SPFH domain-containing protein [Halocalculus aciditolerans]GGL46929.1 phosphoesterase [Halocalculus aciditolerans]